MLEQDSRNVQGAVSNGSLHKVDVLQKGSKYSLAVPVISYSVGTEQLSVGTEQLSKCIENNGSRFLAEGGGRYKY